MSDDTYNGWTNKPTWLVKLWIDNDQGEQEEWLFAARDCVRSYVDEPLRQIRSLSDQLEEAFEDAGQERLNFKANGKSYPTASLFHDLMSWALAMVNWDEVAKALIEDAAEVPA